MRCIYVIHQTLSYGCRATPRHALHLCLPPALVVVTSACRHALFLFAHGLCVPCLWLCACCWLVAKDHIIQLQYTRAHVSHMLPVCVCVCVCVVVYLCMLRVLCNTVCWRRAPRIGQACLLPQSALFANINPAPLEGHAHASKSSQATHLSSQAQWSRSRCSFPDRTGRLPSRR